MEGGREYCPLGTTGAITGGGDKPGEVIPCCDGLDNWAGGITGGIGGGGATCFGVGGRTELPVGDWRLGEVGLYCPAGDFGG